MTDYRAFLRRRMMEKLYDSLSDDEKKLFAKMTIQEKDHTEIMSALNELRQKADSNHHSFVSDFAANIAGNGVWDGIVWLGGKLLKRF